MTVELRAALRVVAASLPADAPVPVPAGQLLALLGQSASSAPAALLTVDQVAKRLGVGTLWVRRHARQLGSVKIGRAVRFSEAAIERYVARRAR